ISATHDYKMLNVSDRVVWVRDGMVDRVEKREELNITVGGIGEKLTGRKQGQGGA
ncbi:MAG: ABC transporter ATP-binding protein, partial [Pseudodesulfovibrio sp.]